MIYSGHWLLNLVSVFFAVVLAWYFGGADFYLHPDRFLASIAGYSEKSLRRNGTSQEGTYALVLCGTAVIAICVLLLYFSEQAGLFWYFIISTAMVYFSINEKLSGPENEPAEAVRFLSYAMPVILYSTVFGAWAAVLYRMTAVMRSMFPESTYRQFGLPAEKAHIFLRDLANQLIPVFTYAVEWLRRLVHLIRSRLP